MRKIAVSVLVYWLCGCASLPHHEKTVFRCSYSNQTTHKLYVVTAHDHFTALQRAHKACKKGPVEWRCYFDACVRV